MIRQLKGESFGLIRRGGEKRVGKRCMATERINEPLFPNKLIGFLGMKTIMLVLLAKAEPLTHISIIITCATRRTGKQFVNS